MKGYEIWTKKEVVLAWSEVYDNMGFPESKRKEFMKMCEEIVDKLYKEASET